MPEISTPYGTVHSSYTENKSIKEPRPDEFISTNYDASTYAFLKAVKKWVATTLGEAPETYANMPRKIWYNKLDEARKIVQRKTMSPNSIVGRLMKEIRNKEKNNSRTYNNNKAFMKQKKLQSTLKNRNRAKKELSANPFVQNQNNLTKEDLNAKPINFNYQGGKRNRTRRA